MLQMNRQQIILSGISKSAKGLEIAPYHSPLASKAAGFNVRILDVFDTPTLKERLLADPLLDNATLSNIEPVDYVGSATEIASLVPKSEHGSFDYIVSSHNFEHLANPIKFLAGSESLLKKGGILIMAVPDARSCFDYYRPVTILGEWLEAWFENREKPTQRQIFDLNSYRAVMFKGGIDHHSFDRGPSPDTMEIRGDLSKSFENWKRSKPDDPYEDAHCTVMTPNSLKLLLEECRHLGLINLEIESVSAVNVFEFYVRLKKAEYPAQKLDRSELQKLRTQLAQAAAKDLQVNPLTRKPRKMINKAKRWIKKRLG